MSDEYTRIFPQHPALMRLALLFCAAAHLCSANMLDRLLPDFTPPTACASGCARWDNLKADGNSQAQAHVDAKWAAGKAPSGAAAGCAMPSNDPGTYSGWCYCKNESSAGQWGNCLSPTALPTQINLQMAGPTEVVASFVTFETMKESYKPEAHTRATHEF